MTGIITVLVEQVGNVDILTLIGQYGFPIAVAGWFMLRMEKLVSAFTEALTLMKAQTELNRAAIIDLTNTIDMLSNLIEKLCEVDGLKK